MNIKGIIPALVTPFHEDFSIDYDAIKRLVNFEIERGAEGFYVCGSTAECFLMTGEERKRIVEIVTQEVNGRVPIIAQVGNIGTAMAVDLARHAASCGVSAVSSVPPFYFKFSVDEIASYYAAISDAAQKPLVIYSIPAFSGVNITHDNIKTIIDASGAEGLKYTSYDLFELERIHRAHPELTLFNGHDEVYANALPIGLSGAIGSTFNLMPGKYKAIREAYEKGDQAAVSQKQAKVNVLIDTLIAAGVNPGIKYLLTKFGVMDFGGCRPPFGAITEEKKALLDAVADEIFAN
ncbi:MAG: N-acetylneuraminate lyase [Clostridia bacterium]|nr:N-acetylneuraminate lyase [Clostridia bacterium]